jgi:hypothetical protein
MESELGEGQSLFSGGDYKEVKQNRGYCAREGESPVTCNPSFD